MYEGKQMKYRKIPVVVDATQWFKNGDHPNDYPALMHDKEAREHGGEGDVVRYFRDPTSAGNAICERCNNRMHDHGWIDTFEGGHIVCVGDFIITGIQGENYPCKPDIFHATYEAAE